MERYENVVDEATFESELGTKAPRRGADSIGVIDRASAGWTRG